LVTKCTTENLWIYVLKLLQDRPMYAYEISKTLTPRFGFTPATVTVYVVLYQMQREGLIQRDATRQVDGKPARKYYRLTATGTDTLQRGVAFLRTVIDQLTAQS
jgi:DNA-binding PadR family transcriptional regulator